MLCDKCHKNKTDKPFKTCDFCVRLEFSEDVLCWIARNGSENGNLLECCAFRPSLTIISSKQDDLIAIDNIDIEPSGFSDKDKWLRAYLKQQVIMNPEEV